ncbi:MAG TPA: hypothetical protein VFR81_00885 [Longimicrobium sp.]|nr:hypothetical protein [Longimicrobium sp.]
MDPVRMIPLPFAGATSPPLGMKTGRSRPPWQEVRRRACELRHRWYNVDDPGDYTRSSPVMPIVTAALAPPAAAMLLAPDARSEEVAGGEDGTLTTAMTAQA